MKKRILTVLLSVLTVVTIFAGCGSSEETEDRERRRESRRTEDEEETKDKTKKPSKQQIAKDMQILSAIATEATEAFFQNYPEIYGLIDGLETKTIVINLGTVHETGKETTTTGAEDVILSKFWELNRCQNFDEIKENMYSGITNIEIDLYIDPDPYTVTVQAYDSDGPCYDPIYGR